MTFPGSLRSRVLIGAALWTIGLFTFAGIVLTMAMMHYPHMPMIFHSLFERPAVPSAIALASMALGFWQVRKGLSALDDLRARLAGVRDGQARQIDGSFPAEVQPLVNDLNALLAHRERVVARAVAKSGDLAHGLKTPLAVLAIEAARAGAAGHSDFESMVTQQIDRMQRQVDYHLAQARAVASGAAPGARCAVAASADGLARTLQRLHADRALTIEVNVPSGHAFRGQREDLDEMLGNLLDNACKWARSRVVIESAVGDGGLVIFVDDDGPGLDPSMRQAVLQRGVRADEAAPGSGLGLAIVRDLAELYGGSIALEGSPLGGLRARLELPR